MLTLKQTYKLASGMPTLPFKAQALYEAACTAYDRGEVETSGALYQEYLVESRRYNEYCLLLALGDTEV